MDDFDTFDDTGLHMQSIIEHYDDDDEEYQRREDYYETLSNKHNV
jgi:hypothetical protein